MLKRLALLFVTGLFLASLLSPQALAADKLKALILDGQNNHNWKATTPVMKQSLEDSGRFSVDVATSPPKGEDLRDFKPRFDEYHVVISNYNGQRWSEATEQALLDYVNNGGGFVVIHAANNSFGNWEEYNRMIGLGGWGGRSEKSGPYVYLNEDGERVVDESKGRGGAHGPQHEFQVIVRDEDHPITKNMPTAWMHAKDELYTHLRGPGANMKILATAYSREDKGGRGVHEPMIMAIDYGQGRVFHTPMGHSDNTMKCVGFITTLLRGSEWAATGEVTLPIPDDFPSADEVSVREEPGNKS